MPGIRLHHPTLKAAYGATLTYVIETGKPYHRGFYDCPDCGKRHLRKAVHLRLDHHGDVIVAKPVYEGIKARLALAGLTVANEVAKPPPVSIGAVDVTKREIVELPMNLDETPGKLIVPGRTKYESAARMEKAAANGTKVKAKPRKAKAK
jgi:hypothetical protein